MNVKFFEAGQLLYLGEDDNNNKGNAEDIKLEGIDVSKWDKRNGLWLVPEECRLEVLPQHYDNQLCAYYERHRTQELVSRNFT